MKRGISGDCLQIMELLLIVDSPRSKLDHFKINSGKDGEISLNLVILFLICSTPSGWTVL